MEKTVYNRTDTMKAVCRNACTCNKRIYLSLIHIWLVQFGMQNDTIRLLCGAMLVSFVSMLVSASGRYRACLLYTSRCV